jgi:hypothetical protein
MSLIDPSKQSLTLWRFLALSGWGIVAVATVVFLLRKPDAGPGNPPAETVAEVTAARPVPANPGDKIMYKVPFSVIQVISPGQALVNDQLMGDKSPVFLLEGLPDGMVDDESWTGWVFEGGTYRYTSVNESVKTVRVVVVSSNQSPTNSKGTLGYASDIMLSWSSVSEPDSR